MKIAIVVHGRWDAFDLASALSRRGRHVRLLTNYPRRIVSQYGVQPAAVWSFWPHALLTRAVARAGSARLRARTEPMLHTLFGRWAAARLRSQSWDVVYSFSGVAEESFRALANTGAQRVLVRESSHIRIQDQLLHDEELRTGIRQERPSPWMIQREEREYALADKIRVLSTFTYDSFVRQGIPRERLTLVPSGARLQRFRPAAEIVERRCERIVADQPLRVLNVGTFGLRKGVWDMAAVVRALVNEPFEFRFVGPIAADGAPLVSELKDVGAVFTAKQAESALPAVYAWGDVFLLPSIEDGFQAVLGQAAAAGLPILTTPNGAGYDLVQHGRNGWVLPIRCPGAFIRQLRWAAGHRDALAGMVKETYAHFRPRDFDQVADELSAAWSGATT